MSRDDVGSFVAEALPAFISEAQEQIASIEQLLLQIEETPGDRELLDALFRCAHTVKGSAGIFGLDEVVAFTHHVETLLDRLRDGRIGFSPELSTLLLQCNDQIRALVGAAQHQGDVPDGPAQRAALIERLKQAAGAQAAATPAAPEPKAALRDWHVSVRFGADTFRNGMDPLALIGYLRGMGSIASIACDIEAVPALDEIDPEACHLGFEFDLDTEAGRDEIEAAFSFVRDDCTLHLLERSATARNDLPAPQAEPAAAPKQAQRPARDAATPGAAEDQRFIRVHADRLDAVINLLGELVIAGAGASMLARQTRHAALSEANQQVGRLIEEIRNSTLQLRMVPIGETFSRFRRVVRDTAAELGKDVALELVGGDTELDRSVVERIADPLMHVVRNALDHGLETAEERTAHGKPAQGTLTLAASQESGSVLIRIHDDGRGIQRDKVLARAWERGLVPQGTTPPDARILQLIFEPGFSTAEKVTNLSGRGVGMDVVRRNIDALRGSVHLASEPGQGSTIEIRLPLTLAIIDGFLVGVGASKFVFPLDAVVEVVENRPAASTFDSRGRSVVELRGKVLPVLDLRSLYQLDSPAPERGSVVVIQAGSERYGVMVDALLGQHQTVIKPLGRMFRSLRGMSGSSILGNGEVALIFDPVSLGQLAAATAGSSLDLTAPASTEGLMS